jgi:DNA-binding beta-propeller fold protein YncE
MSGQVVVADSSNHHIRLIDIKSEMVSTLAGSGRGEWKDGQGEDASFNEPCGVTLDPMSGQVIVADTWNHRIRLIDIKSGMVSTLAGSGRGEWKDGQGEDASFNRPIGVAVDPMSGQVIVADICNNRIRCITNCGLIGVLECQAHVLQVFSDLADDEHNKLSFIPNPVLDIILSYAN